MDAVYFPFWWYTVGAKKTGLFFWQKFLNGERTIGVRVWLVNLFQPMYSQTDWQGRLISFFMRLVQIVFRALALAIWALLIFCLFLGWLALPLMVVYKFITLLF